MLKILVVDDEPKVRRGVSRLIQMYPEKYELMGSCQSADAVIDMLGKRVPDVIVTDIRMPKRDGLELISHLKHRYHNLDFIILSGYGDFEYAKKALQYQVYDFLLKPLKAEELYAALDGVAEKRADSHMTRAESLEDNYFFNLIRAASAEEEQKNLEYLDLYGKVGFYRIAVLDMGEISEQIRQETEILKSKVKQMIPEAVAAYTCFGYQMILILEQEPDKEYLSAMLEELGEQLKGRLYLGISRSRERYEELKTAYFEALEAVKQYIYAPAECLHVADEYRMEKVVFSEELCQKVMNAVKTGNTERMQEALDIFLFAYQKNRCGILRLKRHLLLFLRNAEAVTEELGMDMHYCNTIMEFIKNVEEIRSFDEVQRVLAKNLIAMAKEADEVAKNRMNSFYMNQIVDYVRQNYMNDLSLEEVAEHVNLSVCYLSNYFKGQMGVNFTDYLTQLRMEKAKELLIHTNEKVYRIAEMVGYQNSQYFVTIFKKKLGVTPAEYRKCLTR